jgi:acetyltransferase
MGKPLIVIKIGRSRKGAQSALAHTGALTGSAESYSALFRQVGVIEASEIDGLLDATALLGQLEPQRWPHGTRLGAIVEGGGAASMLCDLAAARRIELPDLSKAAAASLGKVSPPTMALKNPVDLIGAYVQRHPEMIGGFVREFTTSALYDLALYVVSFAENIPRALDQIETASQKSARPVVICSVSIEDSIGGEIRARARQRGIPVILGLQACLTSITAAYTYVSFRQRWLESRRRRDERRLRTAANRVCGPAVLDESATARLLKQWGIPTAETLDAVTEDEAIAGAEKLGFPVVMKAMNTGANHKTEYGLTRVDLRTRDEVRRSYLEITSSTHHHPDLNPSSVVARQPFVTGGIEMFVGGSNRESIGSVVALGLGGVNVELTRDVALGIAPLTEFDLEEMIGTLRHRELLLGFRGRPRADMGALTKIALAIGDLLVAHRLEVLEVDLNPVIVLEEGAVVVDALITTSKSNRV